MSAIINALFGTYPDPEAQNQTNIESNTASTTERLHTSAVSDDVHVRSVISSETQANATLNNKLNINNLLSQLGTTHSQVDQYSRARTAAINDQVQKSIGDVLARTQRQQEELLVDANRRHLIIDNEYKLQLQKAVEALDAVKAKTLADLERDLQAKQQLMMADAKREIDVLNDQANAAKLHALVEAQEQGNKDVAQLADQMAASGQLDTQHLLQSTTTTIITSQAQATGNTEAVVTVPVVETAITTHQHQSSTTSNETQVAVRSPSELVSTSTSGNNAVFTATNVGEETKSSKDNTTF